MSARLDQLALRKEALTLRAQIERMDLAEHLSNLRRPAEVSYQGLKLVSLLRSPLVGLIAASLGKRFGGGSAAESPLKSALRYFGYALAGWRAVRVLRDIVGSRRPASS
jgi:hypothetical protein